jgi:hypothetical protein
MVWRFFNAYVGMTFGKLSVVPPSQIVIAWHCKKTPNTIAKPKLFQNKQIMVFQLHVRLVIGL